MRTIIAGIVLAFIVLTSCNKTCTCKCSTSPGRDTLFTTPSDNKKNALPNCYGHIERDGLDWQCHL